MARRARQRRAFADFTWLQRRTADPDRQLAQLALDHLCHEEYQGWTTSGLYGSWDDLEQGMRIYREAGGTNAVLASVVVDFAKRPETVTMSMSARIDFVVNML